MVRDGFTDRSYPTAFPSRLRACLGLVFPHLPWFGTFMYVLSERFSICTAVLQLQIFKVLFFSQVLSVNMSKFLPVCFTRPPTGSKPCSSFQLCSSRKKKHHPVIDKHHLLQPLDYKLGALPGCKTLQMSAQAGQVPSHPSRHRA